MKKKIVTLILATALTASALTACGSSTASSSSSSSSSSSTASSSISETETPTPTEEATPTPTEEATSTQSESEDSSVPWDYTSALNSAESYSEIMHMSKAGIYDQLTSEYGDQFSAEAAQYAVDNMTADWNANALATSNEMLDRIDNEIIKKFTGLKKI